MVHRSITSRLAKKRFQNRGNKFNCQSFPKTSQPSRMPSKIVSKISVICIQKIVPIITSSASPTFFGDAQHVAKLSSKMNSTGPRGLSKNHRIFAIGVLEQPDKSNLSNVRWDYGSQLPQTLPPKKHRIFESNGLWWPQGSDLSMVRWDLTSQRISQNAPMRWNSGHKLSDAIPAAVSSMNSVVDRAFPSVSSMSLLKSAERQSKISISTQKVQNVASPL